MYNEHESVVLTEDLPEHELKAGDFGVIVYKHDDSGPFEVEFVSADGETICVVELSSDSLRPFRGKEILHARRLAS
jgi:hypothetical protein